MLYYPLVTPPPDLVAQAVLYWDGLGSMAPEYYDFAPELRELEEAGLYTPFRPEVLPGKRIEDIGQEISNLLNAIPAELIEIPEGPLTGYNRLYRGKLPQRIESQLLDEGLIREDGSLYRASGQLLAPILSITARAIADDERERSIRNHWVCHTNVPQAYRAAYGLTGTTSSTAAWRLHLGELFLQPAPGTPLAKLIKFRRSYEAERRQLLTEVSKLAGTLGSQNNPDLLNDLAEAIDTARGQYASAAKSHGIKFAAGSVAAIIGIEIGTLADLEGAIPGMGILGAVLAAKALEYVRPGPTSPYTYLHRIDAQFRSGSPRSISS